MAQTLAGFIDECLTVIRTVSGLNSIPDNPTNRPGNPPYATIYASTGLDKQGPGAARTSLDGVTIAVLVPLTDMAAWIDLLLPLRETVPQALYDQLVGAGFTHTQNFNEIECSLGPIDWGEVTMFGWLFTIREVNRLNT